MLKDPLTRWDGPFPYDALAAAGITPDSSMRDVLDASYGLMTTRLMTPDVRKAWDELRVAERRALVDFFLYAVDLSAEIAQGEQWLVTTLTELGTRGDSVSAAQGGPDLEHIHDDVRDVEMDTPVIRQTNEFDGLAPRLEQAFTVFDR